MERKEFIEKCKSVAEYWNANIEIKTMEECGELIQAISKYRIDADPQHSDIYKAYEQNLIDEIGDIYISLMALQIFYEDCIDNLHKRIDERIETKLNKEYK